MRFTEGYLPPKDLRRRGHFVKTKLLNKLPGSTDGLAFSGANDSFHEVRSSAFGDIRRSDICSAAQDEHFGVQVGNALNGHASLHEFDKVGGAGLTRSDTAFAGIHHKTTAFGERQQVASSFAEIGHGHGAAMLGPRAALVSCSQMSRLKNAVVIRRPPHLRIRPHLLRSCQPRRFRMVFRPAIVPPPRARRACQSPHRR
jgi:hypothetical protein